jgi:hypothetical protein
MEVTRNEFKQALLDKRHSEETLKNFVRASKLADKTILNEITETFNGKNRKKFRDNADKKSG